MVHDRPQPVEAETAVAPLAVAHQELQQQAVVAVAHALVLRSAGGVVSDAPRIISCKCEWNRGEGGGVGVGGVWVGMSGK